VDSRPHRRLALLSIHPHFAEAIFSGRKKVELRRTGFAQPISHVVVYATAPIRRVVGMFEVAKVDRDRPARLWRRYRSVAGVEAKFFRDYYEGLDEGVAIVVGATAPLAEPVPLSVLNVSSAPQSYRYLDAELIKKRLGV
jgi:predicted transcriptional regulator